MEFNPRLQQYEVGATFVVELKADTSLLALDHSYVLAVESGHYQLHNVREGDLAYAMGLRSGDLFVNLNGFKLDTIEGLLEAYDDLEYVDEFFLTVQRGADPMQFTYMIVDDR